MATENVSALWMASLNLADRKPAVRSVFAGKRSHNGGRIP